MRLYNTKEWKSLRARKLNANPYCQCPHHDGQKVPASVVDHKEAHRGNRRLFFKWSNLLSMTKQCHDVFAQSRDKGGPGFDRGCDASGSPLNKDHSWYG